MRISSKIMLLISAHCRVYAGYYTCVLQKTSLDLRIYEMISIELHDI